MTVRHALALLALAALAVQSSAAEPKPFPGTPTKWQGFARHDIEA